MRQLYSVCTYYQLIVAIQIKTSLFPNDYADIIIHDHSVGYQKCAENLRKTNIFNHVYIAKSKSYIYTSSLSKKFHVLCDLILNNIKVVEKLSSIRDFNYDAFYFNNFNCYNDWLYYRIKKENSRLICVRFEEGSGSMLKYRLFTGSVKLQVKLERIHGNPRLNDIVDMYAFETNCNLFEKNHKTMQIPKIDKSDPYISSKLNEVFDYSKNQISFPCKYIFFEESYFADGIDIDDLELVLKIAEHVGKDNLMVKLHPRNSVDRFSELGIKTIGQSGIPWEVIIMNHDFTNNVFLTIASSCVFSPRIIFGESVPTFMLYNCTNVMPPLLKNENFKKFIDKFKKKYGSDGFYIPKNRNEFLNLLQNDI